MDYRVYLFDADQRIVAAEVFTADSDAAASEIALALHASRADACARCEIWHGAACAASISSDHLERWNVNLQQMRRDRSERLLRLEVALFNSFACLRESAALLEAHRALHESLTEA